MRRVAQNSYLLFVLIGALGMVMTAQAFLAPDAMLGVLSDASGIDFAAVMHTAPLVEGGLRFLLHWSGTQLLGVNGLTIFIAVTAYRRGERWAWIAMWYWPLMFVSQALMYDRGGKLFVVQLVWTALSVTALILSVPRAYSKAAVVGAQAS